MEPLFSLEYRVTEAEALATVNLAEPPRKTWQLIALPAVAALCVADFFVGTRDNYIMLVLAGIALVVFGVALLLPGILHKQMARETANAELPTRIWVYEDGCGFDYPDNKRPAENLSLRECGDVYVMFLSAHLYVCIPKRVLTAEQDEILKKQYPLV